MTQQLSHSDRVLGLRPGELVRVRPLSEIFATLDDDGTFESLPFMPEMEQYCGRTFPVFKRADKTCDGHARMRRMNDTVHLANLRCDGAAHGGCQAACLIYWKEAWLERAEPTAAASKSTTHRDDDSKSHHRMAAVLNAATRKSHDDPTGSITYRCQATEIPQAAPPVPGWDLSQYARDASNWGVARLIRVLAIVLLNKYQLLSAHYLPRALQINEERLYPSLGGQLTRTPSTRLDLQPGELVRIKKKEEIEATLDRNNKNRGLSFDIEMLRYCGRVARVAGRVERLIDEHTGKMLEINSDCIILEGAVCRSDYHRFCTRSTYSYWREIWLERVER